MERAEAEAVYDAGREACVEFLVELTARYERQVTRLEARIERLEEKLRESSLNSTGPSAVRAAGRTSIRATFTEVEGVEPTNNRAERGLRAAVIYRKVSLGSQSGAGERFAERMLSVSQTCRLQGRSLFGFLVEALTASSRASPAPSLV